MIIPDVLYKTIELPDWLIPVIKSPEIQRLRDIRLINTSSVSCPTLSDVKRFTHTLGVFHLSSKLEVEFLQNYSKTDYKLFQIASLLHDIGTPPFGHLFEYQLSSLKGWGHERMVKDICLGTYRLEKRYHQIYFSNSLKLFNILESIAINPQEIVNIILGEGRMGKLLSGTIDIDNIDNVYRMAVSLGLNPNIEGLMKSFSSLSIKDGFIFNKESIQLLNDWQLYRKKSYEVIAFDEWCLSSQAMLTECFSISLRKGLLREEHWFYTDEELLRQLMQFEETKHIIQRFAVGDYFKTLFIGWYDIPKGKIDYRHPDEREKLQQHLQDKIKIPCTPYIFYDNGVFSKRIDIIFNGDNDANSLKQFGINSKSTIIGIFTPRQFETSKKIKNDIAEVLESFGFAFSKIKSIPKKEDIYGLQIQREIQY